MTFSTSEIIAEMFTEITQKSLLPIKNDKNVHIQISIAELTLIESYRGNDDDDTRL